VTNEVCYVVTCLFYPSLFQIAFSVKLLSNVHMSDRITLRFYMLQYMLLAVTKSAEILFSCSEKI